MPGPLNGVRILDLTAMISGPSATMMLADQGADVIKVENPATGDHTRLASTRRNGFSASFVNNNRNKRSLAINLKDPSGVELLKTLAKDADVLVQNFRPGVVDRMGIGEDAIRAVAPSIIYVSISGFGHEGPYAGKPVFDPLVQALSGLTTVQAGSDDVRPKLVRTILPDKLTGVAAAQAISAALYHRAKTGEGQHIRLSMLDMIMSFLWGSDMGGHTFVGDEVKSEEAQSFIDLIYETTDGYITVAVQTDKQWQGLCRALEKPEWLDDPRFLNATLRQENINDRLQMMQDVLKTGASSMWLEALDAADVPCAPVLNRRDAIKHPQIVANGIVEDYDHPHAGRLRQTRPAPRFSATPAEIRTPAPALGENTEDILREAGLSDEDIAKLIEDAVVKTGTTT
ncbi:MAG: CoA transferase [Pseudomonadota bacterium]